MEHRSQEARKARKAALIASPLPLVIGLVVIVARIGTAGAGLWIAPCALAMLLCVPAWFLAKLGRTRWHLAVIFLALVLAQFGNVMATHLLG